MPPRVSVIVPVYHARATLRAAAQSVLSQGVDLELILVDDGSADGSLQIAQELAAADARVRLLRRKNAGVSAARNCGLRAARGEYVAFCDDDDRFLPGALALLLREAAAHGADVVRGGYRLYRPGAGGAEYELAHPAGARRTLDRAKNAPGQYAAFLRDSGPQFVWNAVYRRAALGDAAFDARCRCGLEDFVFNAEVYAKIDRAVYVPTPVYRHTEGGPSVSAAHDARALLARAAALPLWADAACRAAQSWRDPAAWAAQRADFVTFLMHQLRDGRAAPVVRRAAWRRLRAALRRCPMPAALPGSPKQAAALLLFDAHLQGLYEFFPNREGTP